MVAIILISSPNPNLNSYTVSPQVLNTFKTLIFMFSKLLSQLFYAVQKFYLIKLLTFFFNKVKNLNILIPFGRVYFKKEKKGLIRSSLY